MANKLTVADIMADVRRELVERAWSGNVEPVRSDHDRGLHDKLYPDRTLQEKLHPHGSGEVAFLEWLKAEWPSAGRVDPATREHTRQPDGSHEHETARQPDLSHDFDR